MFFSVNGDTGRIEASSPMDVLPGAVELAVPDGWDPEQQHNYRIVDGALVHDPLVEEPATDPLADLAELVVDNTLAIELLQLQAQGGEN